MGFFKSKWTGIPKIRKMFGAAMLGVQYALSKDMVEEYFLTKTKNRFMPQGASPEAQTDPEGVPWARVSPATLERRKANRNAAQAMVDTGETVDDIVVLRSRGVGYGANYGFIRIGLRRGSKAEKFMGVLENGGITPQGKYIPPRRVFGVGPNDRATLRGNMYDAVVSRIRRGF